MIRDWDALYDLQNRAIARTNKVEQGFYLTGGTALSRGYYHHRHSEDLDFFVNDSPLFGLWLDRCFSAYHQSSQEEKWKFKIVFRGERFGRAILQQGTVSLKIEFINDVPSRVSSPQRHPILGML